MNTETLKNLGLTNKEIVIYLQLVQHGTQAVQDIAKATGINRSSTYRHVEALVNKDLVEWVIHRKRKLAQARDPNSLTSYLDRKKRTLDSIEQQLPTLITQLSQSLPQPILKTQVRYYENQEGAQQIIWNTLKADKMIRSYTPLVRRLFVDRKFEEEFEREWARRGLKDKLITNENRMDYIRNELVPEYRKDLQIRIIPNKKFKVTTDTAIYNNILSVISFEKDNIVGVEIENERIAEDQKALFDIVWETAKSLS